MVVNFRAHLFLLFLLPSFCLLAQNELVDDLIKKYEDKTTINLLIKKHYDILWNEGKLDIKQRITEERIFLDDNVSSAIKESVSFSSFYNLLELDAASYTPKGSKYKKNTVREFKVNSSGSSSVFYDDSKEKVFYFTNLAKGAKTKMDYVLDVKQPNLLSSAWLQSFYPSEKIQISISFPKEVEIGYKIFNLKEGDYTFDEKTKGDITTYTWTRVDVEEMEYESDGVNPQYYMPQVHPYIKSSLTKEGTVQQHVGSIDNLHAWYRELIDGYNEDTEETTDELHHIVDSLTQDIDNEKDKVKVIFNWVQRNIKYIAFEYELSGFIPRPAAKVCKRRFGDCKDMASIITEMLDAAGIKSYLTWIGTRSIPFTYEEVSTPSVDNHMIATYFDADGTPYFLDATDRYIPFGDVADHIQGKEALVSMSNDTYKVLAVPVSPSSFSTKYDSCVLKIDGNKIIGTGFQKLTGYYRNYATYYLTSADDNQKKEYFQSTLEKGSNKFILENHTLKYLKDFERPIEVSYDFSVDNYIQSYQDEIYVDMNLIHSIGTKIEDDREVAYNYRFAKEQKALFILEIPEGYGIDYLPKNYEGKMKDFLYTITYTQENNKLIYELVLNRSVLIMDKMYFEEWNSIFGDINEMFNESVVLKKL